MRCQRINFIDKGAIKLIDSRHRKTQRKSIRPTPIIVAIITGLFSIAGIWMYINRPQVAQEVILRLPNETAMTVPSDEVEDVIATLLAEMSDTIQQNEAEIARLNEQSRSLSDEINRLQANLGTSEQPASTEQPITSDSDSVAVGANNRTILSSLTPVSGTMNNEQFGIWGVTDTDNYGNRYTSGIYLRQRWSTPAHLVFDLSANYSRLTGLFVLSQEGKNTDGNYAINFFSLVNGQRVLLEVYPPFPVIATARRPIPLSVNVEGVMDLVIEVHDPNKHSNNAWVAFVDAILE